MKFKIVTPERMMLETDADSVTLSTQMGEITVLPHHVPLVANLMSGEVAYRHQGKQEFFAISGGVIEVKKDGELVVLADTAEAGHEIDLKQAEEARDRAKALMAETGTDSRARAEAAAEFGRHVARVKVAHKHRTRSHQHIES